MTSEASGQEGREPECCGQPMVHNSGTGTYECADAFFALLDEGVIQDWDHPARVTDAPPAMVDVLEHWKASSRPDGWESS